MIVLGIDPGYAIVGYGVVNYDRGRFSTIAYGAHYHRGPHPL